MTSPNSVGEVSVEVLADAKALAKSMKAEVEKAFKDLDPGKATEQASKRRPVRVPVVPEPDTKDLPKDTEEEAKKTRTPRVPVGLDPLLAEFQRDVQKQLRALAKTVQAKVPVGADTDELRRELASELARVAQQAKAKIPVEVGDRQKLESDLRAALTAVSDRVKASVEVEPDTSGLAAKVQAAADRAGAKVEVDVDVDRGGALGRLKSLFSSLGSSGGGISGLVSQFADLSGAIQRSAGSSAQLGGSLVGAFVTATGPIGLVIALLAAATAAVGALMTATALLAPAFVAAAGAAAAIPGALAGAGAAFGALALGFRGISEAFKPKAGGGGGSSAVNQARQIASASRQVEAARRGIAAANRQVEASERSLAAAHRGVEAAELRLAEAQKRARQAQAAISRAREEAVESIEDLNRSLRGAQLAEEDAALGVEEALRALNEAQLTGNIPEIRRADLAYRQALQTLEESKDTTADLGKETEEANRKGVEGSQQVQDAYRDQEEALQAVRDAQTGIIEANDSLKSAQDGVAAAMDGVKSAADGLTSAQESLAAAQQKVASGGGGVAKEIIKLAPAAQKFVDAVKALKPAFESLRLDVQQKLFAGLDKTVTNLGEAWIPRLRDTLGRYATTFNTFFKNLGTAVTTTKFMDDLQAGAEGARRLLERVGGAVTSKLVPAFGALARASAPFLERLGEILGKIVEKFSDWVLEGEKSGKLAEFFDRAADAIEKISVTGYQVARIIGGIFQAMMGGTASEGRTTGLDAINDGLTDLADWLNDPANQAKVQDFFYDLDQAIRAVGAGISTVSGWIDSLQRFVDRLREWKANIKAELKNLFGFDDGVEPGQNLVEGLISGLGTAFGKLWDKIAGWLWEGPDSLIGRIKSGLGIESPSKVMMAIGVDLIAGLIAGVRSVLTNLRNTAVSIKNTVTGALSNAGSLLVQTGRNVVGGLQTGIRAVFGGLRTTAGGLRTTVVNALSNAAYWLVGTGRNVVIGLWNGLASLGGWLWSRVQNFAATYVTKAINSALGINSPSKVAMKIGRAVPEGLALGIDADAGRVEAAAERLASAALPQIQDATLGMGWEADAAIRGSLAIADQKQALLSWKTSASGDQLLDAVARLIDISYNSDVQAAFTRTRR
jgi:hypothetical protein